MGRRSHSQTLGLWANGSFVGRWTITARGDMELQYDATWVDSPSGRPISLSLPFNLNNEPIKGTKVDHYFEGLLPDSDAIRKRVAARFKVGSTRAFDLLGAIGLDCVGALQLLPEGDVPSGGGLVEGIVVDEEDIERHLLEVVSPDRFGGTRARRLLPNCCRQGARRSYSLSASPGGHADKMSEEALQWIKHDDFGYFKDSESECC